MPAFSDKSESLLKQCHPDLQKVFNEVIKHFDCSVITGHRGKEEQNRMFEKERSKVQWPDSKHNQRPSLAVDVAPYPISWKDRERFYYFSGFVQGIATSMEITIRWGGDWDQDTQVQDQSFDDLVHFEL